MSRISSIDMLHIRQHHQFADPSLNFFYRIQFETEIKGSNEQKIREIREENDEEGKKRKWYLISLSSVSISYQKNDDSSDWKSLI